MADIAEKAQQQQEGQRTFLGVLVLAGKKARRRSLIAHSQCRDRLLALVDSLSPRPATS